MADNVTSDANTTTGAKWATDEALINSILVHIPINKICFGALDTATLVDASNPFPVTVISGSLTANAGTNLNTSALALEATLQSIKTAVELIDNSISGSETQVDIVAALPTGANVIGGVTQSGTWNIATVTTVSAVTTVNAVIPGTGATNLGKQVDLQAGGSDVGIALLGVRQDIPAGVTPIEGDYVQIRCTNQGAAWVQLADTNVTVGGSVTASQGGTWNIGTVTTLTTLTGGGVAHDSADTGTNPIKVGGRATSTEITAIGNGDRSDLLTDLTGRLQTRNHCVPEDILNGTTSATGTANTEVIAAQAAGVRIYVTKISLANSSATDDIVEIKDGTTVIWRAANPAHGGNNMTFDPPLKGTVATALNFASLTGVTTAYFSAHGYKGR